MNAIKQMFNISLKINVREVDDNFVKDLKYVSFPPCMQIPCM